MLQLQTPYQDATSLFGLPGKTNLSSHLSLWHGRHDVLKTWSRKGESNSCPKALP